MLRLICNVIFLIGESMIASICLILTKATGDHPHYRLAAEQKGFPVLAASSEPNSTGLIFQTHFRAHCNYCSIDDASYLISAHVRSSDGLVD